ncbi:IS3 family transposase [Actinomadura bangladeshensis]|uniref:IS3 family transposase n=1 Tax=Actinomadura bangladeshensis TaxID=453573 RepID=UPI001FB76AF0|nr:IS3 family transposase [Actinomadura bangladeshensis]
MTHCRDETLSLLVEHLPIRTSCALSGVPRSSFYRRRNPAPDNSEPMGRPAPPNALSESERAELVETLNSDRFADKAPRQVWAALLDEGVYLASVSTMYRELRRRDQVRERRAQARHQARTKPYLAARAPNQIWSWDITKLPGPGPRQFYDLYVMLDIFSRLVVHWEVHLRESGELAEQFMQNSFVANGGIVPGTIHSDNGTSMTSKPVTELLADLDIIKSHSRPKVSNDNPFSEAQFKTLKYCPVFPARFDSLDEAETFCHHFFDYYNHRHYHAGIGLHTPFTMHIGTAQAIQHKRAATIAAFRAANPQRFTQTPTLPKIPTLAQINRPAEDTTDQTSPADQEKHAA